MQSISYALYLKEWGLDKESTHAWKKETKKSMLDDGTQRNVLGDGTKWNVMVSE